MPREAIKKLYYSIGEVSEATDLKQYVLRYWESEFPQLSPAKNRAGNRTYREKDIELVNFIKTLLYEKKYTIEGARQKLKELQDNGLALSILSLEDPIPAPPAAVVESESNIKRPKSSVSPQAAMTPASYKKFLVNLRTELKQLIELIDS
ncbi:MAG: MerR family transcriptional regulator [Candidatus Marinimicrobia bacterium]|jgi:DNA-binding transcriptional MerR regulator|nr:MerR family transcriptional regulator [Candidatus Neomarinimicrobiota bacterium]MBT3630530.1 MerR family transcriptional regulator [Candidatus Neomarinimicrobiota bacterium]MBT3823401.1 MerR family transcriptional regulator [Candidatus Neomarinimicrobiota bacterium]MBT4131466.1 MerR family transcriptional regulator [Candidatus Neomarinimicrobiota bacterium]MBT4295817.1 MerR family transcriptional regulator [Candidatus Neomarinimicrobiota bacterium]